MFNLTVNNGQSLLHKKCSERLADKICAVKQMHVFKACLVHYGGWPLFSSFFLIYVNGVVLVWCLLPGSILVVERRVIKMSGSAAVVRFKVTELKCS